MNKELIVTLKKNFSLKNHTKVLESFGNNTNYRALSKLQNVMAALVLLPLEDLGTDWSMKSTDLETI